MNGNAVTALADRVVARLPRPAHRTLLRLVQPWRLWLWGVMRRTITGVMVLGFTDDGRLLLVRHSYHLPGAWLVPGGGGAPGEAPVDTATRELAEETGCTLHDARSLGRTTRAMPGGWTNRIEIVSGRIIGTPVADGREIIAVMLASPDALPAATHDAVHAYLQRWREAGGRASKG